MTKEEALALAKECGAAYGPTTDNICFLNRDHLLAYTSAIEQKYHAHQPNNYLGHITDNELISELNTRFGFEPVGYVRQYGPDCLKGTLANGRAKSSTQIDPEPITDDDIPLFRLPSHTDAIEQKYQAQIAMLVGILNDPNLFTSNKAYNRIVEAVTDTQQSAEAWEREVKARELERIVKHIERAGKHVSWHHAAKDWPTDAREAIEVFSENMAAELRNQEKGKAK